MFEYIMGRTLSLALEIFITLGGVMIFVAMACSALFVIQCVYNLLEIIINVFTKS